LKTRGTLKGSTQRFRRKTLKARLVIASFTIFIGIVFVVASALSLIGAAPMLNWIILLAVGTLLCVAGFVLLVMELLETWLSRGQKALVDGLQAG
jgi:fatty acid desaturase